jgi:hypothetical protein
MSAPNIVGVTNIKGKTAVLAVTTTATPIVKNEGSSAGTTIVVTASGSSAYVVGGSNNATISVVRGATYTIRVSAVGHPFWIQTSTGAYNAANIVTSGITINGTELGYITYQVPADAPDTLYYVCQNHSAMAGSITVTGTASNSGKVFKVNALYISNVDGTNNADVTVDIFRSSTAYRIVNTVVVPADAVLDVISKAFYLEEGDSLRLTASANSDLEAVCSYEEIS